MAGIRSAKGMKGKNNNDESFLFDINSQEIQAKLALISQFHNVHKIMNRNDKNIYSCRLCTFN